MTSDSATLSRSNLGHHIPFGTFIHGIPLREVTIPECETITMFGYGTCKTCSCFDKEVCPIIRIKIFSPEHGNKIVVAKLGRVPIFLQVMLVNMVAL